MLMTRFVVSIFSIGLMVLGASGVSGQGYPNKPIRIATSEPGGAADFAARLIAQGLSGSLGQPVIVDNRPQAVAIETVAKAQPDGYTLLVGTSILWIEPFLRDKTSYDPVKDFAPITIAASYPNILVVHPSLRVNSVKELIALAKARPGELNYASSGTGGSTHLTAELFKAMAGVNIVRISYRGGGQALNDLIGGQVQLMFASAASGAPHIKSGKLRALAVTTAKSSTLFPELPTIAASGVPGYESTGRTALFVPAKTPEAIIKRMNQEIVRVLNQVDVKEKFFNIGVETVGSSPDELATTVKSEMARMGKVIKDAGIAAE